MVQWDRTGASKKVVPIVQTSHYQYQQQPHYGGSVPRQSISLPPIQKQTQGTQNQGRVAPAYTAGQGQGQSGATLKQSATPTPSPAGHQSTYNMKQNSPSPVASPSAVSPRQQPFSITSAAASASGAVQSLDRPSLMMDIPSSSLYLSFDDVAGHQETYSRNQERHQQQALRYQQKLQQKPSCQQDDEDTDDDSESGSIVSFQRSIHRLSMTYNGRPGMLNIRLFGPHQRTQVAKHGRSVSGSSIVSVSGQQKDQKDDKRLQQRQPRQQQDLSTRSRPSDESDRPRIVRAYTEETLTTTRPNEVQVPGRSTSADNIYIRDGRPRQQVQETQHQQMHQPQIHHHHYPKQYHTSPSSPTPAQSHPTLRHQHNPRPSHESAQSMRSLQSSSNNRPDTMQRGRGDGAMSPNGDRLYSQNPARPGNLSPHPLPTTARGGVGAGRAYGNIHINMHPAHHFPTHGYVRPEEAVGPSNPMPEKAEDYVRQGIEYHELGEISKATHYFRTAAELGDPVGMLMYGLSVRHGWGCVANRVLAFQYLQKSAEHAVGDLNSRDSFASTAAKGELVLAIYELGICFRHGWGVEKNKKTAAYYFEIAANLVSRCAIAHMIVGQYSIETWARRIAGHLLLFEINSSSLLFLLYY
ncbi:hypothetical protein EDD11_006823 [Mortierella claussenii]|nr:hypothetical protein EDD11_006823 [Mortierella claussenii]